MMGIGWTEMLVIGIVALIFIGPKDLPVVMARVGKVIGQIQRMGREFQREINKTTGLDEVRNLRASITSPLRQTAEEIRREFNAMGSDGKQTPTGALKPADPKVESVVDDIHAKAGMTAPVPPKSNDELAAEYGFETKKVAAAPVAGKKTTPPSYADTAAAKAKAEAAVVKPAKARAARPKADKAAPTTRALAKPAAKPRAAKAAAVDAPVTAVSPAKPARKPRQAAPDAVAAAPADVTPKTAKPRAARKQPAKPVQET